MSQVLQNPLDFPLAGSRLIEASAGTGVTLMFLCEDDVFEDPKHPGFIMPISSWNRYRHDTYKDDPVS